MPTTEDRIRSIESARRAIEKQKAAEAVKHARTATGPFLAENRFATGDKFLSYRKDAWTGPHMVYETLGDTDVIILDCNTRNKVTLETSQLKLYVTPSTEEQNFLADHRASIALAITVSYIQAGTPEVPLDTNTEYGLPPASIQETYGIYDGNDLRCNSIWILFPMPTPHKSSMGRIQKDGNDLDMYSNMDTLANANATQVKDGKNPEIAQRFSEPRRLELEGLLIRGVFELRNRTDVVWKGIEFSKRAMWTQSRTQAPTSSTTNRDWPYVHSKMLEKMR
jgi:hypothetical protein